MEDTPFTARLTVQKMDDGSPAGGTRRIVTLRPVSPPWAGGWGRAWAIPRATSFGRVDVVLFSLALVLYLATRLIGLTQYPIYFHGDEAIHTVYASELIRDKGVFEKSTFLPTYFKNGPKYNLSLSVYLQVLPALLFGKSVLVTRGTSILLTLIPAAVVALIIRDFLRLPYWWTATLLLSIVPAWFLHSRTAFETVLSVSMYAGFLYFYLRYRLDSPKFLYLALTFGALTFYAYSPAQLIIVLCGLSLLLLDFRYHLKHWRTGLVGVAWLMILALPYIRFRLQVSEPIETHLQDLGSYWLAPLPLSEKLSRFAATYFYGLSPGYWYFPNLQDLFRHQMGPYSHIWRVTLPFALIGIFIALKSIMASSLPQRIKSGWSLKRGSIFPQNTAQSAEDSRAALAYRTIFVALLIAPVPGTLAQVGITRVLTFIIPITVLTGVGLIFVLHGLERWLSIRIISASAMVLLVGGLIFLTRTSLQDGPTWVNDYGFGGMQYGAKQVFERVKTYLEAYNDIQVVVTPNWANGSEDLAEFFLENPFAIEMASIDSFLYERRNLETQHILVLTPEEYEKAEASNKFKSIEVKDTLPYPNGLPGFYFVHLTYADNLEEILAEERESRHILQETTLSFRGIPVLVRHSKLDIGLIDSAFDGNDETLMRTKEVNPFVVEMTWPEPREFHGISVNVGSSKIRLTVQLFTDAASEPQVFSGEAQTSLSNPVILIDFGRSLFAQSLRIEVLLPEETEFGHVHVWEIRFLDE